MFLATTGLTEFWDTSSELLLLGKWCCRYDKKSQWEGLDYQVMSYPWNDKKMMYAAYFYCNKVYERMLANLIEPLNTIHGIKGSLRYWRIVIGEWLWRYIQVIYDRYCCIEAALQNYEGFNTILLDKESYQIAFDYKHYFQLCNSDLFNLQIFSQILREQGWEFPSQPYTQNQIIKGMPAEKKKSHKHYTVLFINYINQLLLNLPPKPQVVFCGKLPLVSRIYYYQLLASAFLKYRTAGFHCWSNDIQLEHNENMRGIFKKLNAEDSFQRLCTNMLFYQFPKIFLEGFPLLQKQVKKANIKNNPQMIISPIGWRLNSAQALYIAECVDRGTSLVGMQHGGGYGIYKIDSLKDYEIQASDRFISWGWGKENKKIVQLPVSLSKRRIKKRKDTFLYVSTAGTPYFKNFQSSPLGPQFEEYFALQNLFFTQINRSLLKSFIYRGPINETGWYAKKRLGDNFNEIIYDNHQKSFLDLILNSSLVVIDNNQTTYLEAFAHNIPTIIFWDQSVWELNASAKEYFEALKAVNVFHSSPYSAAAFINDNYKQIDEWWYSKDVQEAVQKFVCSYVIFDNDWVGKWRKKIETLISTE